MSLEPITASDETEDKRNNEALGSRVVRGSIWTIGGYGGSQLIRLGSNLVLTRLLFPEAFGLMAIVFCFGLLLENFGINGFTEAIIQSEDLDHKKAAALFWINAVINTVLALLFALAGPLLAAVYGEPELTALTAVYAVSIVLAFLPVHHLAMFPKFLGEHLLHSRKFRFQRRSSRRVRLTS